jgi:hypothetical protein
MKTLRCLFLVVAASCMSLPAFSVNFHTNILDPNIPVESITSNDFMFSFSACQPGELPNGVTADGCFAGENATGQTWTSLTLEFSGSGILAGGTADCTPAPSDPTTGNNPNIFAVASCTSGNEFIMSFSDGSILSDGLPVSTFLITESGVTDYSQIPGEGLANETPEPQSFVLMFTGMLLLGSFFSPRFRQLVRG